MKAIFNTYRLVRRNAGAIYALIILESIISALTDPLIIYATKLSVDSIVGFVSGGADVKPVIFLVLLFAWKELSKFFRNILDIKLEQRLELNLNKSLMNKLSLISVDEIEKSEFQDKLNQIKDRPHLALIELFNSSILILSTVIKVVGIAFVFFNISGILGISYLIAAIFDILFTFMAVNKMNKMFENTSRNEREMENVIDILKNKDALYEIKVFKMKNLFLNRFEKYSSAVFKERLDTTLKSQNYLLLSSVVNIVWMGLVILFIVSKLLAKAIGAGDLTAIVTSASSTLDMAEDFVYEASNVSNNGYIANTLFYILSYDERKVEKSSKYGDEIEFSHVSFKYPGTQKTVLHDLSFKINKDKVTAIVGENGAGKSTIIKLVAGLYEPTEGSVRISNMNPYSMSNEDISNELSIVFQDFKNYEISLRDNILFGKAGDIAEDLRLLELDKYSEDTNIGKLEEDGVYLSGGENQKLALARAIQKKSDFLIFDEPTASMDPMVEAKMYDNILKVLKSRGAIIITHRLVLSKLADDIIVLNEGRIIERGSHDELMNRGGIYKQMYDEQSGWYKEN
ncbi:ABC-type multidrug transport system fused ATPase/permease subunit [Ezakiella coagulans]|uniref:ABC-type multidrug transport system fused ATPase/permease subunit n=1 Tax=Ezakiella coagulans TaxID=46507 RepID=A0A2U1E697_9FIRM|nr:ABC transporter ATP-binding protein [Ezakiella coagulans]PVY95209.1 ABC-type multidrug transport system fused ATPase/permease subunit [Ezakiella coagulans]